MGQLNLYINEHKLSLIMDLFDLAEELFIVITVVIINVT